MPEGVALQSGFWILPGTKYSYLGEDVQEILILTISEGTKNGLAGEVVRSDCIVRAQMGEAPVIPEATADMGVLSLLPTQVATR